MPEADPFHFEDLDSQWLHRKPGAKWHKHGPEQLNAWVADMDWRPAPVILDKLRNVLDRGDLGYPDWWEHGNGMQALFAQRMAEKFDWMIDPDACIQFNDVVQALQVVLHHRTEPGDAIAYHVPSYPPFHASFESAGLNEVQLEGKLTEDGWRWDLDELRAAAAANPRLKVLLVCNPQNPTGRCFTRDELTEMASIADEHNLLIISDEIHADLVYAPCFHIPIASLSPEVAARTVTITAASKSFNLAALRWAIAHIGPKDLLAELQAVPNHLYGATNLMAVAAVEAAWTAGGPWLDAVVARLDANRFLLRDLLKRYFPEVRYRAPEATYLAWLDFRTLEWDDEPAQVASRRGVELSPGTDFGKIGTGWARMNFATSPEMIERIVKRIARRMP
jgi:cysteine-S-conjugate beta-lyase